MHRYPKAVCQHRLWHFFCRIMEWRCSCNLFHWLSVLTWFWFGQVVEPMLTNFFRCPVTRDFLAAQCAGGQLSKPLDKTVWLPFMHLQFIIHIIACKCNCLSSPLLAGSHKRWLCSLAIHITTRWPQWVWSRGQNPEEASLESTCKDPHKWNIEFVCQIKSWSAWIGRARNKWRSTLADVN